MLWHLCACMKRAVRVGLRSVEESTVAAARMLDWDGIRGLLTRCGRVGSRAADRLGSGLDGTRVAWHVVCVLVACPRAKRLGGRGYVRMYVRLEGRG